jgi:hypothetical protein
MTPHPIHPLHRSRSLAAVLAMLFSLVFAWAAAGQTPDVDDDLDGVMDSADLCLDTPPGDLVGADGCSLCPCEGSADGNAWTSHRDYVACVGTTAKQMKLAHLITRKEMKAAVKAAKRSSCGSATVTRCCVYTDLFGDAEVVEGRCRLISEDACLELDAQVDLAEDIGAGSCLPNPCLF